MSANHPRPWHRGSVFGVGPRRPLDREQRARFRFLLLAHARAGRLSPKAQWVGEALLKRLGPIRKYPNRVACDCPARGFPLLERFVIGFG